MGMWFKGGSGSPKVTGRQWGRSETSSHFLTPQPVRSAVLGAGVSIMPTGKCLPSEPEAWGSISRLGKWSPSECLWLYLQAFCGMSIVSTVSPCPLRNHAKRMLKRSHYYFPFEEVDSTPSTPTPTFPLPYSSSTVRKLCVWNYMVSLIQTTLPFT